MIAAFATLFFLSTILVVVAVGLHMLAHSGGKIVAALKGQSVLAASPQNIAVPVRVRTRAATQPVPVRAHARLRAAA